MQPNRESASGRTRSYSSWLNMKFRCSPGSMKYRWGRNYYGKGIRVCSRWLFFGPFLKDMGERPAGTTLDRIDGKKGYEPGNCRWATKKVQMDNRAPRMRAPFKSINPSAAEYTFPPEAFSMRHPRCTRCGRQPQRETKGKRQQWCNQCHAEAQRSYRLKRKVAA